MAAGNAIARDKILGENDQTRDVAMETASKRASRPSNFDGDKVVSEISLKPCSLSKVDPGKFVECESSGLLPQKVTESSTSCKGSVEITQNDDKCGGCSIPWSDSVGMDKYSALHTAVTQVIDVSEACISSGGNFFVEILLMALIRMLCSTSSYVLYYTSTAKYFLLHVSLLYLVSKSFDVFEISD